jgi:hypothetical protein
MQAQQWYQGAMPDEDLSVVISVRVSREDKARLDDLAKRVPLKALAIARIALRLGITEIEREPGALFRGAASPEPPPPPPPVAAPKKGRSKPLPASLKSERPG